MEELEKQSTFELEVVANKETGELLVPLTVKKQAVAILSHYPVVEITNDSTKKTVKEQRALLNKIAAAIDRKRIDTVADFTSAFEQECNEIRDLFKNRANELGVEVKKYEDAQKVVVGGGTTTVKKYTATVKFTDEKIIKKLTDFCTKNGCELSIK